jgi:two-component system cell cycle response regulator
MPRVAFWHGADDVMPKPLDDVRLMARMRALLRARDQVEELRARSATLGALGLAEAKLLFERPSLIGLVSSNPGTAMRLRDALAKTLREDVVILSRDEALAEAERIPDAYVIEADLCCGGGGLTLISDLRSRGASRNAAICLLLPPGRSEAGAIAFDLGANDVVSPDTDPQEIGLRLSRLLQRKRSDDRVRDTVNDGLRLAVIDPLTGLHNRRYALPQLGRLLLHSRQTGSQLALMVIDLDRFKSVNDMFGHAAGDHVLVEVARRLLANLRKGDLVARIGGEEFLVALPETGLCEASQLARRLCEAIEETPIAIGPKRHVALTVSIGLAEADAGAGSDAEAAAALVARADGALLRSKAKGRNRVTVCRPAA